MAAKAQRKTATGRSTSSKRTTTGTVNGHTPRKGTKTEKILTTYGKVEKSSDSPISETAEKVGVPYQSVWGTLRRYEVI